MSVSEFQQALHKFCTTLKRCKHKSDYAILYDYMDMEHLLCHSCWTEEKPVRIDEDTKDMQTKTVACNTGTVPELQHVCYRTEKMHEMLSIILVVRFELCRNLWIRITGKTPCVITYTSWWIITVNTISRFRLHWVVTTATTEAVSIALGEQLCTDIMISAIVRSGIKRSFTHSTGCHGVMEQI